jgi:hypothetical protein
MSIELLRRSDADVEDDRMCSLLRLWSLWKKKKKKKKTVKSEEEKERRKDCKACKEEEWWNAAINEVKRPRIALRSLKECEKVRIMIVDDSVM